MRQWTFSIVSTNPMTISSRYISVEQPDMRGTDRRYRPVIFSIETHIRVGTNLALEGKKRRRRSDADEVFLVKGSKLC